MKKTLLSSLLSETSKMGEDELKSFYERAEANPFSSRGKRSLRKLVRDIDDLDDLDDVNDYNQMDWAIDKMPDDSEENLRYIAPHKKRNYKRNEYNQERDIEDIDMDPGKKFMMYLNSEDDEIELMDDSEYDDFDEFDEFDDFYDPEDLTDDEFDNLLNSDDEDPDDEFSDEFSDEDPDDEFSDEDLDPDEDEMDNGKYQGIIRSVKGAYLVSKLQQPDETYTEIWVYNVGKKYDDEANIRKAILSGTDIDPTKNRSEDDTQEAYTKSVGNVQFLTVSGLPD